MNSAQTKKTFNPTMALFTAAAFVIVIAGMRTAQDLIIPFLLAAFIAIICAPALFWLKKKGLSTGWALMVVILGFSLLGLITMTMIGSSVNDFSRDLPRYQAQIDQRFSPLINLIARFGGNKPAMNLSDYLDPGMIMRFASGLLSGLGNALSNIFIILLTVTFILLEASSFRAKLETAFAGHNLSTSRFDQFIDSVNRYMAIKTWVSLATGVLIAIWLSILKVDYPLLWGLLAFLLNYVPNIGSIIAAVPAVMLAYLQFGLTRALLAGLAYVIINVIIGNVIEPRYMGKGLGLSTLVVFLSLAFWGWVLGPVGMLLSVPLTMTVKIALDGSEDSRWISTLMG